MWGAVGPGTSDAPRRFHGCAARTCGGRKGTMDAERKPRAGRWNKSAVGLGLLLAGTAVIAVAPRLARSQAEKHAEETTPAAAQIEVYSVARGGFIMTDKVRKSDDEWRKQLSEEAFHVTREKGTERAFSGKYWDNHEAGVYRCVACGNDLFTSDKKFESGTGWPSFWAPVDAKNVEVHSDKSYLMDRNEVVCSRCGSHLGHVFDDGPKPTGLRYCM